MGRSRRLAVLLAALALGAGSLRAQADFLRGDPDESGGIEITDAIRILHFLFLGRGEAIRCQDAADADDQGGVVLGDALYLLNGLFLGGPAPPPPFPRCGVDPTEDALDCAGYEACKPPTVQFFGIEFEAQGVFFVVDTSGTFLDSGELARAKQEIVSTVSPLTEDFEFAALFFNGILLVWPVDGFPAKATEENKMEGIARVQAVQGGAGTCPRPALLRAVQYAERSSVRARAIFYVTDGGATCAFPNQEEKDSWRQTIDEVTAANNGTASLHSIQLNGIGAGAEAYMRELAEKNGGTFHQLDV